MTNQEKIAMLEDIMELDENTLTENTDLMDIEEWDSLSVLSFMAMLDSIFGKNLPGSEIRKAKTISDLMKMMEE